jgi:hypothetical protein
MRIVDSNNYKTNINTYMARQNTRLESEGAEFLVLGNLLTMGIPSFKAYTNIAGYDIIATLPESNTCARIQVKSRWRTGAEGFIINNFDCDFVVVVFLNRGSRDGSKKVLPPEFYVLPVNKLKPLHNPSAWGKQSISKIENFYNHRDQWGLIKDFLHSPDQSAASSAEYYTKDGPLHSTIASND